MTAPLVPAGSQLGVIDVKPQQLSRLETGFSSYSRLAVQQTSDSLVVVTAAGSASKAQAVVKLQVRDSTQSVGRQNCNREQETNTKRPWVLPAGPFPGKTQHV